MFNVHYNYDDEGKVGFANKQDIKNSDRVQWRYRKHALNLCLRCHQHHQHPHVCLQHPHVCHQHNLSHQDCH